MELSSLFLYKSIQIDKMEVIKTDIEGVLIIEPRLFRDARGYFFESFSEREFKEKVEPLVGYKVEFCQDNESMSSYGVMRGLHFQRPPFTQSKLVRCVKGRVIIIPSFFVDKASCTRQFESEFSLHSLASLFPIKEGSTSHLGLLPSGKKRETALRCSEPLRYKVGGPSKVYAMLCGMGPPGDNDTICLSLMHIYTSLRKTKTSNKYIVISSLTLLQIQRNPQHF